MPELQRKNHELNDYSLSGRGLDKARSVLILECDPTALNPVLSATADQLAHLLRESIYTDIIAVTSEFEYQTRLSELKAAQKQYSLVVVLGEGNATRLALTKDRLLTWAEFTYQLLLPFEPDYLLLLSTISNREIPAHTFFEAVPMLKEVYTSIVADAKLQADVLKFMVSYLTNPALSEYDRVFSAQVADKLLNSGMLMRWTWRDSLKQRLLNTFELLTESEKLEVAAEIIRRTAESTNNRFAQPAPAQE